MQARDYVERFARDLPPRAQSAMAHLIETIARTGEPGGAQAQAALDEFLDAAGQGALKAEPARTYVRRFLETPNVIASRYLYKDASKRLEPEVRAALIALIAERFFWEVWTFGPEA